MNAHIPRITVLLRSLVTAELFAMRTPGWRPSSRDFPVTGKLFQPLPPKRIRRGGSVVLQKMLARQAFPNNLGNYPGKRIPRPSVPALTPRERFIRLEACYLGFAHIVER